jgi:hypothetical protein
VSGLWIDLEVIETIVRKALAEELRLFYGCDGVGLSKSPLEWLQGSQ